MSSYSHLCKKAGLPAPTGLASFERPRPRRAPRRSEEENKALLRSALEKMVACGELAKTADGRYYLP